MMKLIEESSEEHDDECMCLVCLQEFIDSKKGEKWVQCLECKKWAHVKCTKDEISYVCLNCNSEMSE